MRTLLLLSMLAGCAAPPPYLDTGGLQSVVGKRVAGHTQRCVPILGSGNGLQSIDAQTLFYRAGRTVWINRLAEDCPRLGPHSSLSVKLVGNRYCQGDLLKVLEPGTDVPVAVCALGQFTPYR